MKSETINRLVRLNRDFYDRFGDAFAESRRQPQPGWQELLGQFPGLLTGAVLDVGCADGRFGRFLRGRGHSGDYVGVDFSASLLAMAPEWPRASFLTRDLSSPDCLAGVRHFDFVVCLSTLQHIPGRRNRQRLLSDMVECLVTGGTLVLANWQFTDSERQRQKIRSWAELGLDETELESGDYLMTWQRGGSGYRYVALLDEATTLHMAAAANLRLVSQFRHDGREGNLNLYSCLRR